MDRAYSFLEIKSTSETGDQRIITGIATTPKADRYDDIVEPLGVKFRNPLPLLWQHRSDMPVGTCKFDKPTEKGIGFTASLPMVDEPGTLKDRIDEAWQSVKLGLVKAVSIGFRPLEYSFMDSGGIRFDQSEVMELSLVTIPANSDCTIQTVKSFDHAAWHKSGRVSVGGVKRPVKLATSGAPASPKSKSKEGHMAKPLAEQIAEYRATKNMKSSRVDEILDAAAEKGETCDASQMDEIRGLEIEIKTIDEHLEFLVAREKRNVSNGKTVDDKIVTDTKSGDNARDTSRASVPAQLAKKLPKGTAYTRFVIALARARGNRFEAAQYAKEWADSTPEVEAVLKSPIMLDGETIHRAAINPGTTTDATFAGPLVQLTNMASEFIELLRPQTILGRITGFRQVPFNIKVPRQTAGATVNWVGEASVKPLTNLAFDSLTLQFAKVAGIVPLSEELIRFSSPSAEALVTADLTASIAQFLDQQFIDPTNAAVTNVHPAAVTYGATSYAATGTTAAALRTDVKTLMASFLAANLSPESGVWIMTAQQALAISLMTNALGNPEFPGVNMNGGNFVGFPVIVSENVPSVGGSPTDGSRIVFLLANQVLVADDGGVSIDVSREASLQMDSAPDSPATSSTVMVSLWQNNLVGIKAERYINWVKRHDAACAYLNYTKYAE